MELSYTEHARRKEHKRLLEMNPIEDYSGENMHVFVGIESKLEGICPKCKGKATVFRRYDSSMIVCNDYICFRTFGTLSTV